MRKWLILKEKRKEICLALLAASMLFTLLIPSLFVWTFPRLPPDGLNFAIGEVAFTAASIIRATSLFIVDITIKVTLLLFLFKKQGE